MTDEYTPAIGALAGAQAISDFVIQLASGEAVGPLLAEMEVTLPYVPSELQDQFGAVLRAIAQDDLDAFVVTARAYLTNAQAVASGPISSYSDHVTHYVLRQINPETLTIDVSETFAYSDELLAIYEAVARGIAGGADLEQMLSVIEEYDTLGVAAIRAFILATRDESDAARTSALRQMYLDAERWSDEAPPEYTDRLNSLISTCETALL